MIFTNEDLKRLKEMAKKGPESMSLYALRRDEIEALSARLEAAESCAKELIKIPLGRRNSYTTIENKLDTWRKSCGLSKTA